jgi:hypothetical protein
MCLTRNSCDCCFSLCRFNFKGKFIHDLTLDVWSQECVSAFWPDQLSDSCLNAVWLLLHCVGLRGWRRPIWLHTWS